MGALTYPMLSEKFHGDVFLAILKMDSSTKVSVRLSRALRCVYYVTTDVILMYGSFHIGDLDHLDLYQAYNVRGVLM